MNEKPIAEPSRRKKRSRFTSSSPAEANPKLVPPAVAQLRAALPEKKVEPTTNATGPAKYVNQPFENNAIERAPPFKRRRQSRFAHAEDLTQLTSPHPSLPTSFDLAAIPIAPPKTLRINKEAEKKHKLEAVLKISDKDFLDTNPRSNPHFDPSLRRPPRAPRPIRKEFKFVDQGAIVARAAQNRHRALAQARRDEFIAKLTDKSNISDLPVLPPLEEDISIPISSQVPTAEWWDLPFIVRSNQTDNLKNPSQSNPFSIEVEENRDTDIPIDIQIREERITHYIHHPLPVESVKPKKEHPIIPLMLTKKETKKLRRQRRMEAQKEQQEMIAAGLLPPLPPKVKLNNMMRVLTTEVSVDPTKMETEVRAQVEARRLKHEAENEARKKSGEEKREKARHKREKDRAAGLHAAVFRVADLSFVPHRFKVDRNAKQLELTGIMVLFNGCNVVVVEGGEKALRKYKALMLRRIDWTLKEEKTETKEFSDEDISGNDKLHTHSSNEKGISVPLSSPVDNNNNREKTEGNGCVLVWEGIISSTSFKSFAVVRMRDESSCRRMFSSHRVEHYWDLCLQASPVGNESLGVRRM